MLPAAFRRKSDSPASNKGNAAGLAALTKEEPPAAQSVVATTSPAPAAPAAAAPAVDKAAAAPQRPPPRPSDAGAVPQLNRYVRSQLPKGEVSSIASFSRQERPTAMLVVAVRMTPTCWLQTGTYHELIRALGKTCRSALHHASCVQAICPFLSTHALHSPQSQSADLKHTDSSQVSHALLARKVTRLYYQ